MALGKQRAFFHLLTLWGHASFQQLGTFSMNVRNFVALTLLPALRGNSIHAPNKENFHYAVDFATSSIESELSRIILTLSPIFIKA